MAGEGRRFKDGGYSRPKPLIELEGIPLFRRAVIGLDALNIPVEYFFIVRQEHIEEYHIDRVIREYFPCAHIIPVEYTTRGAVETCMLAAADFLEEEPLLVVDCDLEFKAQPLLDFIQQEAKLPEGERSGGALISFFSQDARYSYAQVNDGGEVVRTAEKEVISTHALAGAYYFSSAKLFKEIAAILLRQSDIGKPEYYLSLLYNLLIQRGNTVRLFDVDAYVSNGTPEELTRML